MANFIGKKKKRLSGKNVRKENEKEWGRDNMEEMRGGGEGGGGSGGKVINFLLKGWLLVWFNSSESGWFLRGKLWPAKARLLQDSLCHTHKHMYAHTRITSSQTQGTVSALVERSHLYDWICIQFLAILYLYNGFNPRIRLRFHSFIGRHLALKHSYTAKGKKWTPNHSKICYNGKINLKNIRKHIFTAMHDAVINSKSRGNRLKFFWDML